MEEFGAEVGQRAVREHEGDPPAESLVRLGGLLGHQAGETASILGDAEEKMGVIAAAHSPLVREHRPQFELEPVGRDLGGLQQAPQSTVLDGARISVLIEEDG